MKKFHRAFCCDCCALSGLFSDLSDEVLACEPGEVLELDLGDVVLHVVVVDDKEENSDD